MFHKIKIDQSTKIVFLGCGSVSKCCLHYFMEFFQCDHSQITVIDKDKSTFLFPSVQLAIRKGVRAIHHEITRQNIAKMFDNILNLEAFDVVIDLTTNTPTYKLFKHCRMRKLLYINTSIEDDDGILPERSSPINESIFLQHINLQSIASKTEDTDSINATTLIEFGMNPGLISVFVKRGILDIAKMVLVHQKRAGGQVSPKLLRYYKQKDHRRLAEFLKIRAIHCSEIDTQIPHNSPMQEFYNTWSCVGLITEGVESAQIQIGTHEKVLPFDLQNVDEVIPQLVLTKKSGRDVKFQSIVPLYVDSTGVHFTKISGRCIPHGEGISLNRYLGTFRYAPTMHYVYQLNPLTDSMLSKYSSHELVKISEDATRWKVLNMYDDMLIGYDNVGALFVMEENPLNPLNTLDTPYCFWTGSILHTDETMYKLKDPFFGPTTIQVMAGVLSGVCWMLDNPERGLVFGEDLDDDYILKRAKPYLGTFYSGPVLDDVTLSGTTLQDLIVEGQDDTYSSVDDL